jgi:hypothetical protein
VRNFRCQNKIWLEQKLGRLISDRVLEKKLGMVYHHCEGGAVHRIGRGLTHKPNPISHARTGNLMTCSHELQACDFHNVKAGVNIEGGVSRVNANQTYSTAL